MLGARSYFLSLGIYQYPAIENTAQNGQDRTCLLQTSHEGIHERTETPGNPTRMTSDPSVTRLAQIKARFMGVM